MRQLRFLSIIPILLFCVSCGTLDKSGVYGGDKFLYDSDMAISSSYTTLHVFVKWEYDNRAILTQLPAATQYADTIRRGAPQWFSSAYALRDAYKANPTASAKTSLQQAIDVLRAAVTQATQYMAQPTNTKGL